MKTIEEWIAENWEQSDGCWVAMDEDGKWFFFEKKPIQNLSGEYRCSLGSWFVLEKIAPVSDWTKSLQQIKKPVNPNDWIGKLCAVWDDGVEEKFVILDQYAIGFERPFVASNIDFEHCRPLTKDEALALVVGE